MRDGELPKSRPAAVVWPRTAEEVAAVVAKCAEEGIPIAPFGAGSGVCGGTLPDARTVVMDLKRLARVRALAPSGAESIEVEAGAMGIRLEEDLAAQGYTLGHFPSSILCSTVGGWVAARSAGQCSGKYGKIEDMVVSLECVVGRGEIVRFRRRVHGPDATPLLIGSEGILGVVTSAELRLHPQPAARTFAAFAFPSIEAGWETMRDMFQAGMRPAVARLYDAFDSFIARRGAVKGAKKHERKGGSHDLRDRAARLLLKHPSVMNGVVDMLGDRAFGGAMLVLVFESSAEEGAADREKARLIAARNQARDLGEAPARHWLAHRYSVSYRQAPTFMMGAFSDTMEVASSWSRLGALYEGVRAAMAPNVFVMAHLSHAYPDGCSIYFTFAGCAETREEAERLYDRTWSSALTAAIEAGGTLSHHHGVGRSKAPKLGDELGAGVDLIEAMSAVLDPASIFNPGNLLPPPGARRRPTHPPSPRPRDPEIDEASLLVHAHGETPLGAIEDLAAARGMTLAIDGLDRAATVAAFLSEGAKGAPDPWEDPADHLVAGFTAKLASSERVTIAKGPRRAVGPDLFALFAGTRGAVGVIEAAHLRLHRKGMRARRLATSIERDPPMGEAEERWLRAIFERCRNVRSSV